jgi:hypothetical protein
MVWRKIEKIQAKKEREESRLEDEMLEEFLKVFFEIHPPELIKEKLLKSAEGNSRLECFETPYEACTSQLSDNKHVKVIASKESGPKIILTTKCLWCLKRKQDFLCLMPTYRRIKKAMKSDFEIEINHGRNYEYGEFTLNFYESDRSIFNWL